MAMITKAQKKLILRIIAQCVIEPKLFHHFLFQKLLMKATGRKIMLVVVVLKGPSSCVINPAGFGSGT
jgi:hypothetical protein